MNTFEYKNKKEINYFEGWYLRVTDENTNANLAFIFAVSKYKEDPHAFIQIYDGIALTSKYYRFEIEDFKFSENTVFIKDNYLSSESMYLKTSDIEINVQFNNIIELSSKHKNNSAMSFLVNYPLECFQEVNIMEGSFTGKLNMINKTSLIAGKIYLEKTYGNKFPDRWIWLQCNYFDKDVSLTFAYGRIPLLKWKVKGFFSVLIFNGKEYRFASYNLARMKYKEMKDNQIEITLKKRGYKLIIIAEMIEPVKLVGPLENGQMTLEVLESINSKATVIFSKRRRVVFDTKGRNVGLEIKL